MKKSILAMCSVVAISGVSLAAQQPSQPPAPQPTSQTPPTQQTPPVQPAQRPPDQMPATREPSPSSNMARTATTVTGCLKTWDSRTMAPAAGAGSGAGSAASPVASAPAATGAAAQYILSNVEGATAASRAAGTSFLLATSDSSVSFSQHLNHKVQLTGTIADGARMTGSDRSADQADRPTADKPSADRDASASGRVSASDMKLPTFTVTALKMVSPTCGTGS